MSAAPRDSGSLPAPARAPEYEFSDEHKETLASLAASMSFVGVCAMLLGVMSLAFALGAGYSGFPAGAAGLGVGAAVCVPFGLWTISAGRSLSSLVRTRGRDVAYLMDAVRQMRRLFALAPVLVVAYAATVAAVAWCTLLAGGKCLAW